MAQALEPHKSPPGEVGPHLPPRSSMMSRLELQEKRSTAPSSSSARAPGRASSW